MRQIIKKIIVLGIYYSGLNWIVGKFLCKKVFCVGYHSVWDEKNQAQFSQNLYWNISVSSKDFEDQILFLKKNGHSFIQFSDLKSPKIKETRRLDKPTVIFFDDGFKDVLVNALPILKKYEIPATIFITTGLIDRSYFLWTLKVRHLLSRRHLDMEQIERKVAEMKKLSITERGETISVMEKEANLILNPSDFNIFLNWDEIRELSKNNFEIGSHGVSHEKFVELSDGELKLELVSSRTILEQKTGAMVGTISYPYGRYNERIIGSARSSRYSLGLSTLVGSNSFEYIDKHPFQIKRINPEEDKTLLDFKVRLYTNI